MKLIQRDDYLNKMIRVINTSDIKVITGVRRASKSKLLELFIKYIEDNIKVFAIWIQGEEIRRKFLVFFLND